MTTRIRQEDHLITPIYEGKKLSLLEKTTDTSLDQEKYPIAISPCDMETMDFPIVIKVLTGEFQLPSSVTKVSYGQMQSPVIEKIDHIYQKAMGEYKKDFKSASNRDGDAIVPLEQQLEQRLDKKNYTTQFLWRGLLFPPVVGAIPGYFNGKWMDILKEEQNASIKRETRREQSTHRRARLQKIDELEKKRYEEMKNAIRLRIEMLLQTIKELEERNASDTVIQQEIYYLFLIYKDIFSNKPPLVVYGIDINQYLEEKGINESTIIKLKL